jgi:hypothetical protein
MPGGVDENDLVFLNTRRPVTLIWSFMISLSFGWISLSDRAGAESTLSVSLPVLAIQLPPVNLAFSSLVLDFNSFSGIPVRPKRQSESHESSEQGLHR